MTSHMGWHDFFSFKVTEYFYTISHLLSLHGTAISAQKICLDKYTIPVQVDRMSFLCITSGNRLTRLYSTLKLQLLKFHPGDHSDHIGVLHLHLVLRAHSLFIRFHLPSKLQEIHKQ